MSCYIRNLFFNLIKNPLKSILHLTLITSSLWISFITLVKVILPSRPLDNFTCVIWGLANGSLHILIFSVFDLIFPEEYRFIVFAEMISEYRISAFIISNLMAIIIRKIANRKSIPII